MEITPKNGASLEADRRFSVLQEKKGGSGQPLTFVADFLSFQKVTTTAPMLAIT